MGYYITSSGNRVELQSEWICAYVSNRDITKLVLHKNCTRVVCDNNKLKELILPQGLIRVDCEQNNITELIIPQEAEWVRCDLMDGIEEQHNKKVSRMIIEQKR